jgi:hypothetical protein
MSSLALQYNFDMSRESVGKFFTLLAIFATEFLSEGMGLLSPGSIMLAFAQKIEKRRMGIVSGVSGIFKPTTADGSKLFFYLLEFETPNDCFSSAQLAHPVNRGIQLHLHPKEKWQNMRATVEAMRKIDALFSSELESTPRWLLCPSCQQGGEEDADGRFDLEAGLLIGEADTGRCSRQE